MNDLEEIGEASAGIVKKVENFIKGYGWFAILAFASVPNPLFDLAGLLSGFFEIPFVTFFSAVALGKSVLKTHLQMVVVIFVCSDHLVAPLTQFLEAQNPWIG